MNTMKYATTWQRLLGEGEKVEYEFSVSNRYRKFNLIIWAILSLLLLPVMGLGVLAFLVALFHYGYYMRVANAYAFTNKRVLVNLGWLSKKTISVDYSKITDVHIDEPFFDRLITHTGNLAINTAGTSEKEVILKHIEKPHEVKKKLDALKG